MRKYLLKLFNYQARHFLSYAGNKESTKAVLGSLMLVFKLWNLTSKIT